MQRFKNDRQDVPTQVADDSNVEGVDGKARPQISAEKGECGNGAFHLPTRSDAARKLGVVGDDECRRLIHFSDPAFSGAKSAYFFVPAEPASGSWFGSPETSNSGASL